MNEGIRQQIAEEIVKMFPDLKECEIFLKNFSDYLKNYYAYTLQFSLVVDKPIRYSRAINIYLKHFQADFWYKLAIEIAEKQITLTHDLYCLIQKKLPSKYAVPMCNLNERIKHLSSGIEQLQKNIQEDDDE
jgi:hypothetical protein